mgnify:CR=1 FL=1
MRASLALGPAGPQGSGALEAAAASAAGALQSVEATAASAGVTTTATRAIATAAAPEEAVEARVGLLVLGQLIRSEEGAQGLVGLLIEVGHALTDGVAIPFAGLAHLGEVVAGGLLGLGEHALHFTLLVVIKTQLFGDAIDAAVHLLLATALAVGLALGLFLLLEVLDVRGEAHLFLEGVGDGSLIGVVPAGVCLLDGFDRGRHRLAAVGDRADLHLELVERGLEGGILGLKRAVLVFQRILIARTSVGAGEEIRLAPADLTPEAMRSSGWSYARHGERVGLVPVRPVHLHFRALRRDLVGIVFQAFRLIPSLTALQNVAIPLELAGRDDVDDMAKAALQSVGLAHRLSHLPDQMSGGEQQRVAIARAMVTKPRILLADEPTGNLDSVTGEKVIKSLFKSAADANAALVLVTHDANLAAQCSRVLHIEDGVIVRDSKSAS